ncbi:probable glutathione S-transferase [Elaeis guineensis]|uniref:glutathione transferase n=1 Tax=Elaeis guineensis var. tenera TaxID=51953 RepID=A0A6I9RBB8_ELAGV|nr:probable glutathione S-transferase [Elaeis guineensis]
MEVKLFGAWSSPFVRRVEWALKIKGIKYEYIEEDLYNKSPSLLTYSPINKQVPVLLHDGKPIIESMVIIEYIDDTWKQKPLLPIDPYQRSMARFWSQYVEDKFYESVKRAFFTEGEEQKAAVESAVEALKPLEQELKGKKFFCGEEIGFVDLVAGWIAHWLEVVEEVLCIKVVDPENFPSLCAWMKNFVEVPVIKENLPARDQMPGFYRMLRQSGLASCDGK